jgi:acetolactate synthase-1/2/3 large subunit
VKNFQDGGEAIVEAFRNLGMDYILSSPGSEWSPVWEAMARLTVEKNDGPKFIDCWHETVAVDMAMGYTSVTGKLLPVLIHAGVGLMHGSMAMLSASQAEVPMLVMSGESTSFGADPEMPVEAQWYGGVSVGGAHRFVDPIVKWATQVTAPATLYQTVVRAGELAQRVPQGPVYVNVSLEAMLHEWKKPDDLRRVPPAPKTQALQRDIDEVAALLRAAKYPTIFVETAGRDPAAFRALVALADRLAIPVVNGRGAPYSNFPRSHPMWLGYGNYEPFKSSDLILLVSGRTPWYPPSNRPGTGKIVSIGENPLKMRLAYQQLHADLYIEGDVASALTMLLEAARPGASEEGRIAERRKRWTAEHDKLIAGLAEAEKTGLASGKIDSAVLAAVAGSVFPKDMIYTDETITHMPAMRAHLPLDDAQSFFRIGGGGLGQGIGAALGVKLGAPDRPVSLFVGDGSLLYNPIIQGLAASKSYDLPILIVVCNNGKYEAMRKGHVVYYEGGVADTTKVHYGVNIDGPEYQDLGSHFGFFGAKATTPDELRKALTDALAAVKQGRTAIVNVVMVK